jgi:hypothetical protein
MILSIAMPVFADQFIIGTNDSTDDDPFVNLSG